MNEAVGLPVGARSGKLTVCFSANRITRAPVLRLLPLPLCIAFSLHAHAADDPPNWGLCPVQDVVKPFVEAQAAPEGINIDNSRSPPT